MQPLPLLVDEPGVLLGHTAGGCFLGQAAGVLLGLLAGRQVTGDFREAEQLPVVVLEGRDDDVGPKLRAVLANPPALVLEPSLGSGHLQFVGGPAPVERLLRVERREVLADDLVGLVLLDPLGPGVPGGDVAVRVEHEDGVVLHALDQ